MPGVSRVIRTSSSTSIPVSATQGLVHAPFGIVVEGVNLKLARDQIGTRLDHLGKHAIPEPDHGYGGQVAEGERRGRDKSASPITPEITPGQAPPDQSIAHCLSPAAQIPEREVVSSRSTSKSSSLIAYHRALPRLVGGLNRHDRGDQPRAHHTILAEGHRPDELIGLVVVSSPCRQEIFLRHLVTDLPPDDRSLGERYQQEFPYVNAVTSSLELDFDLVVVDEPALLYEIVIREVGAHPRTRHHRGRQLERAVYTREVVPDLLMGPESGRSGLFLRCASTRMSACSVPRDQARKVRDRSQFSVRMSIVNRDTRLSPHEPVHAVDNFTSALGMGGERRKEASQEAQPDHKAHSDPEPAGYPAPAGTPESTRGPKRPWGHWGPSNV